MIRRIALQSTRDERLLPDLAGASAVERLNKKGLGEGARQDLLAIAGLGELPPNPKPDVIVADLPGRIAQVLRVLCVIASVGSHFSNAEVTVIKEIVAEREVDWSLVTRAFDRTSSECVEEPPARSLLHPFLV